MSLRPFDRIKSNLSASRFNHGRDIIFTNEEILWNVESCGLKRRWPADLSPGSAIKLYDRPNRKAALSNRNTINLAIFDSRSYELKARSPVLQISRKRTVNSLSLSLSLCVWYSSSLQRHFLLAMVIILSSTWYLIFRSLEGQNSGHRYFISYPRSIHAAVSVNLALFNQFFSPLGWSRREKFVHIFLFNNDSANLFETCVFEERVNKNSWNIYIFSIVQK